MKMFSSRRLAKRSIVGTRVVAPYQDGRYMPGIVRSSSGQAGQDIFTVQFDHDNSAAHYGDRELIGPGFKSVSDANQLPPGQVVYVTHCNRELRGLVMNHDPAQDLVHICIQIGGSEPFQLLRRLDEVRLMESRKSARLLDSDMDYCRLADLRPTSHSIDVPNAKNSRAIKPMMDAMDTDDADIMDTTTAALVLTSLSCSPKSPTFINNYSDKETLSPKADGALSSSIGSSGICLKSEPHTPSPSCPYALSSSAPGSSYLMFDEGIELDDSPDYYEEDEMVKKRKTARRREFKCTWRGCGKISPSKATIESHVRNVHLREVSDEEEFYYDEVEINMDRVTETFANMNTSSLSDSHNAADAAPDHTYVYQKKSAAQPIPGAASHETSDSDSLMGQGTSCSTHPAHMPRSQSWQFSLPLSAEVSNAGRRPSPQGNKSPISCSPKYSISCPPKASPLHKKPRSDVKKCRKVYGMDKRDMWCTQCKWKKACTRFLE